VLRADRLGPDPLSRGPRRGPTGAALAWRAELGLPRMWLASDPRTRPRHRRACSRDEFARAPDGVHIAYQLLGDIGIVHRAFGRADSVLWLVPPDPQVAGSAMTPNGKQVKWSLRVPELVGGRQRSGVEVPQRRRSQNPVNPSAVRRWFRTRFLDALQLGGGEPPAASCCSPPVGGDAREPRGR
jgi:hypothetical protein